MNTSKQNQFADAALSEAEETLRLIARISAPEGLEERVQAGLRKAKSMASTRARILHWPVALQVDNAWMQNLARTAAAAAIVAVVVGGGWRVSSRFQPAQPSSAVVLPPHSAVQGGFSSAGAMRTPQTLNGPVIAPPAPAAKPQAAAIVKPTSKAPLHRRKPVSAKNPVAPAPR
jgi:hypothetical protein